MFNPYLAVLAAVAAASFSALFVRLATAPPLIIATYRLLFTFLALAPFSLMKREAPAALDRRQVAGGAVIFSGLYLFTRVTARALQPA